MALRQTPALEGAGAVTPGVASCSAGLRMRVMRAACSTSSPMQTPGAGTSLPSTGTSSAWRARLTSSSIPRAWTVTSAASASRRRRASPARSRCRAATTCTCWRSAASSWMTPGLTRRSDTPQWRAPGSRMQRATSGRATLPAQTGKAARRHRHPLAHPHGATWARAWRLWRGGTPACLPPLHPPSSGRRPQAPAPLAQAAPRPPQALAALPPPPPPSPSPPPLAACPLPLTLTLRAYVARLTRCALSWPRRLVPQCPRRTAPPRMAPPRAPRARCSPPSLGTLRPCGRSTSSPAPRPLMRKRARSSCASRRSRARHNRRGRRPVHSPPPWTRKHR
mmetsp:Transcript_10951/g.23625  ORF Transcript_10951/g.23625 Transcript_10951/m.23625 type:complete len:336 (+) Transcript_10951:614-1621(+)